MRFHNKNESYQKQYAQKNLITKIPICIKAKNDKTIRSNLDVSVRQSSTSFLLLPREGDKVLTLLKCDDQNLL